MAILLSILKVSISCYNCPLTATALFVYPTILDEVKVSEYIAQSVLNRMSRNRSNLIFQLPGVQHCKSSDTSTNHQSTRFCWQNFQFAGAEPRISHKIGFCGGEVNVLCTRLENFTRKNDKNKNYRSRKFSQLFLGHSVLNVSKFSYGNTCFHLYILWGTLSYKNPRL